MQTASGKRTEPDVVGIYLRDIGRYPLLSREDEARLGRDIARGVEVSLLLSEADDLSPERVTELRRAVRQAEDAKRKFLQSNLRLVVSIAKKYRSAEVPLADCIQEGTFGLIRAIEKFDYTKGFKFSTYATWWIRQSIQRGVANTTGVIRMPIHAQHEASKVRNARTDLTQRLERLPTVGEVADEAGMSATKVLDVLGFPKPPVSLDLSLGESGTELSELLADDSVERPDDAVVSLMTAIDVERLLEPLKERERQILIMRFGLDGNQALPLSKIAEHFGLSRERIRQIEAAALNVLRQHAESNGTRDLLATK